VDSIVANLQMFVYFLLFIAIVMFFMRWNNNKKCKDNILCRFVSDEGTGYKKFMPVIDGVLHIMPTKKRAGAEYAVGNLATHNVNFPEGVPTVMSFIQANAKECWFDERTAEPLSNRSPMLLLTPSAIYNIVTERFTEQASGKSQLEQLEIANQSKSLGGSPAKSGGMSIKTILIIVGVLGMIVAGIYLFMYFSNKGKTELVLP
jgi:hypothetical protein